MNDQEIRLMSIMMPHAHKKRLEAVGKRARLVHYTSAEAALKIIQGQEVWLRDSRCMNDYQEVLHGAQQVVNFFGDTEKAKIFTDTLDLCHPGAAQQAINEFMALPPAMWANTFLLSFSEHDPEEDTIGRLSMWRAYGRKSAGVALVMNIPMDQSSDVLNAFLSPVGYFGTIEEEMAQIISNITANRQYLASLPYAHIVGLVFMALTMAAVCLKHPGFREEREWRFVHLPARLPSTFLRGETETIAGIPQKVFKMKLADAGKAGIKGLDPASLMDRVIIGPTTFPYSIQDSFVDALRQAGVPNPYDRVIVSNIPLRT